MEWKRPLISDIFFNFNIFERHSDMIPHIIYKSLIDRRRSFPSVFENEYRYSYL